MKTIIPIMISVLGSTYQAWAQKPIPVTVSFGPPCEVVAGIEEDSQSIRIFPNPSEHEITIQSQRQMQQVVLYAANGAKVADLKPVANTVNIDCKKFAKGIYMVKVTMGKAIVQRKIVIK